ncbi:hemagglutinin repeat-containing protein [Bartonella tamiae]|uniref:hemagglutinin repeat-containing protein n=1 Tax=Bartonella tamiae TaxID=373638 RepID=UPI0009D92F5E|nr:hemagglutinin repeat-containing protein [Bartonella tamiae]
MGVGFNHSKTESSSTTSTPVVTTLDAGRAIDIEAGNKITSQGAQINVGSDPFWNNIGDKNAGNIDLTAKEINLNSAIGTTQSKSSSKASGALIGMDLSGTPNASGYYDKSNSNSNSLTHTNTHVTGTGTVTVNTDGDFTLKGATVSGNKVVANVGGSLIIESQIDVEDVKIKHDSISGNIGANTAGVNVVKQNGKGNSFTVNEQSGIHAGDEGFDLNVDDKTALKGGLITSTAGEDKNKLVTGTITFEDINTSSSWDVTTKGGGYTIGTGKQGDAGTGPLVSPTLNDSGKDKGKAQAAVSPGQIIITKKDEQVQDIVTLNRDPSHTNDKIDGIPDLQKKLNEQLKTQQEWTEAAKNMAEGVKKISDKLKEQTGSDIWGDGGAGHCQNNFTF